MKINIDVLNTEQQNPNTLDIDRCGTQEMLTKINAEDQRVAQVVQAVIPDIVKLVDTAAMCLKKGGRILYVGAGTSGRLGVLDASECPPTYGVSPTLVQGLIAGGVDAMFTAQEGAEDSEALAKQDLQNIHLSAEDIVIGLAASGRTPYVMGALRYAHEVKAATGSICCVEHGQISALADHPIEAITGAEAVTGSTRMKAGTAQKLILNMISTACMIKLGKVYHNLMVDVQPTNAKLEVRACRIIAKSLQVEEDKAHALFIESGKDVKTAIVMGASGKTKTEALAILQQNEGNVANTIRELQKEDF